MTFRIKSYSNFIFKDNRGFTLVELLITMLVIGILSAMILPAISKSRNLARKATCASNLKQIGTAFGMYIEDFHHMMPRYLDWHQHFNELYLDDINVFSCPAEKINITAFDSAGARKDLSYGINARLVGWFEGGYGSNIYNNYDGISTASGPKILIADNKMAVSGGVIEYYSYVANGVPYLIGDRHNNGANVLFTDLHVGWKLKSVLDSNFPAWWTYDGN